MSSTNNNGDKRILSLKIPDKYKFYFILAGIFLISLSLLVIYNLRESLTEDSVSRQLYRDYAPTVTADDGMLIYDSVSVRVPEDNVSYTVGYDWAREDKDYPTVPTSASAFYTNKSGQPAYEILLYRDKVTQKGTKYSKDNDILETWFDEWASVSEPYVEQHPFEAKNTSGILVKSHSNPDESTIENCSYTYYFVIETASTYEQFVVDISFLDSNSIKNADAIFKNCADGISVNN